MEDLFSFYSAASRGIYRQENISISNSSAPKLLVLELASMIVCNSGTIRETLRDAFHPLLLNYFVALCNEMSAVDAKVRSANTVPHGRTLSTSAQVPLCYIHMFVSAQIFSNSPDFELIKRLIPS